VACQAGNFILMKNSRLIVDMTTSALQLQHDKTPVQIHVTFTYFTLLQQQFYK